MAKNCFQIVNDIGTWCQFNQHFMSRFFTQKCFAQLLCASSLAFGFFGIGNWQKPAHKMMVTLTRGCQIVSVKESPKTCLATRFSHFSLF